MAALQGSLDEEAAVEWGKFGLRDDDGIPPGEPGLFALGFPETMLVGPNSAVFRSGGAFHNAAVRLESWSGRPPAPDGHWDTVWEDDIGLTSGSVRLAAVTTFTGIRSLPVGPGGGVYRMRVCCRGRENARIGGDLPDTGQTFEHWVIQFWPR